MTDTVLLEELSWPQVEDAVRGGVRTIVIVAASIEQHGPHLPTMTDTAIGYAVGELVARKLGRALLAPVVRPGCSDHHLAFPGSISIPPEILIATIRAYVRSLSPHGFETFVLLSSHGGNFDALEAAARGLREEFGSAGVRIVGTVGRQALLDMMRVMVEHGGGPRGAAGCGRYSRRGDGDVDHDGAPPIARGDGPARARTARPGRRRPVVS